MHVQGKLIERALQKSAFETYGELADHLGVTAASMSQWRSGASKLPTKRMEELAAISGDDPGIWAITLMAEEANVSTNLRSAILRVLKTTGSTIALLAMIVMPSLPRTAQAATGWVKNDPVVCIMRNYWDGFCWGVKYLRLWLSTRFGKPQGPYIEAKL